MKIYPNKLYMLLVETKLTLHLSKKTLTTRNKVSLPCNRAMISLVKGYGSFGAKYEIASKTLQNNSRREILFYIDNQVHWQLLKGSLGRKYEIPGSEREWPYL